MAKTTDENRTKDVRELNAEELSIFCLKLSMMVKSGINVEKSVAILLDDASTGEDKELLSQIHALIDEGYSLSKTLEQVGRFPKHMIRMIDIGQVTGKLEAVLSALSEFYRREASVAKMIRNAVMYPAIMLVVTAVILLVLVSQVLPVFQQVFRDMGASLSATVTALLFVGDISKIVAVVLSCVFVAIVIIAGAMGTTAGGRAALGRAVDQVFFGNKLNLAVSRSRFASAMSLMLSSGLNMGEALERSGDLIGEGSFSGKILDCREKIETGTTFPKAAEEAGIFTGMQSGLLSAGFRSGITEQAMHEVSGLCAEDSDTLLFRMVSRVEPVLIVVLALSVGLVLLSVMLPLIGMMTAIGV
ncbi:MAG: type II secretion system F family protein [Clostridiales Family XIII bacterium]|jgi:type IV pilus assembly protein PilC|nr:type II secretion system F family protein [Clostridiales Family XIII bacterium]